MNIAARCCRDGQMCKTDYRKIRNTDSSLETQSTQMTLRSLRIAFYHYPKVVGLAS